MMLDISIYGWGHEGMNWRGFGEGTHPDDVLCARLRGEHAQNPGTAADIKHGLSLEEVCVIDNRVAI